MVILGSIEFKATWAKKRQKGGDGTGKERDTKKEKEKEQLFQTFSEFYFG